MSRVRKPTAKSRRVETKSEAKAKSVEKPKALTGVGKSGTKISKLPEGAAAGPKSQLMSLSISQSLKHIREASTSLRSSLLSRSGIASLLLVATALLAGGGLLFQNQSEQASAVVAPAAAPAPMAQVPAARPAAPIAKKPLVVVEKSPKKVVAKKPTQKSFAKSPVKSVAKSQATPHGKKQTSAKDRRHADRRMVATTQY